jgi:hypothetical protein
MFSELEINGVESAKKKIPSKIRLEILRKPHLKSQA